MKKSAKIAGILFLVLSVLDVAFIAFGNETVPLYIKPLLMPSLALTVLLQYLPEIKDSQLWLLIVGLYFHCMGDVLLMFDSKDIIYFALGLGAFLIGHCFYLTLLFQGLGGFRSFKEFLIVAVPVILAPVLTGLFGVKWPMSAAVVVYAYTLMVVTGVGLLWKMRGREFWRRIFFGGLLFIISDGMLALNAFAGITFPFRHALVMLTYLAAEWLLVSGMMRNTLSSRNPKA
ncbi:MAG: lysoplasmalogenase [Bacteroidales bacterium]|nr:lysoplasmalogenase [Bacteroidales bacterium]